MVACTATPPAAEVYPRCFDNIAPTPSELGKNLCTEIWKYSDTAVTCVRLKGSLIRKFRTTDPSLDPLQANYAAEFKQDIDLDYLEYVTSTYFGDLMDGDHLIFKFPY